MICCVASRYIIVYHILLCVYCTILYAFLMNLLGFVLTNKTLAITNTRRGEDVLQINASKVLLRSRRICWTKHSLVYWPVDGILI